MEKKKEFACPVVVLETVEGRKLAAGCICYKEYEAECIRRLNTMKDYRVNSHDLVEIDYELAEAVSAALNFGAELRPVVAAGCTIRVTPVTFPDYMTTGGVLGDPIEEAESSTEETEALRDGFSMLTLPGSPGLAADVPEAVVEQALYEIKQLRDIGVITEFTLKRIFEKYGITTGLLIFDGTGKTARGVCAGYREGTVNLYQESL